MPIQLTEEQQKQLDDSGARPAEVIDPRAKRRYVLVPAEEYDALRDDRDQAALRKSSLQNLSRRVTEDE
jgi:hypothetical protein